MGSNDNKLCLAHCVVAGVCDYFIPHEGYGFVFEAPCFYEFDADIELWSSGPHVVNALFTSEFFHIEFSEFVECHCWVVVSSASCFMQFII